MEQPLKAIVATVAVLAVSLGGVPAAYAERGQFRQTNIRTMREQVRADRQVHRETRQELHAAKQQLRAARGEVRQRIRAGEFNVQVGGASLSPTRRQRREIRQQLLADERANVFAAHRDRREVGSILKADRRLLAGLKAGPGRAVAVGPGGRIERLAKPASRANRHATRVLIREDRGLLREAKGVARDSRQALKAGRTDVNRRIRAGEFDIKAGGASFGPSRRQRQQIRQQLLADLRTANNTSRLNLRREKTILSVHRQQLQREQGLRRVP